MKLKARINNYIKELDHEGCVITALFIVGAIVVAALVLTM